MLTLLSVALVASVSAALSATPVRPPAQGHTRAYFIAADEVVWDYAPTGINQISGKPFDGIQTIFTKQGPQQIGSKSKKALYRGLPTRPSAHSNPAPRAKRISAFSDR